MQPQKITRYTKNNIIKGLTLGILVAISGIILASTPFGRWLEEDIGLSWLFKLRGPQAAPDDVVVVSIDQRSSAKLQLPNKPRKWPRLLHANLVEQLSRQGARVIAFDIIFDEQRNPEHNYRFARALQKANNVILFQYLKQENLGFNNNNLYNELQIEKLVSPIRVLEETAFGLAPFPLPKVPAKVNHFLLYKPSLGDAPTMPVVVLQSYALPVYDELYALLKTQIPDQLDGLPVSVAQIKAAGRIQQVSRQLRSLFNTNNRLAATLSKELSNKTELDRDRQQLLTTLIETYDSRHSKYLNFYGPPRTIRTISYHEALTNNNLDLTDKVVFVGFSEQFQPEQKDGFYTVYSEEHSGLDISGVEIIATAYANLLHRQTLSVSGPWIDISVLLLWGVLLGAGLRLLPGPAQIPVAILLALIYSIFNYLSFSQYNHWLPLATPVLWQVPLAALTTLLWKYLDIQRERKNIRQAFGYHLPVEVVDQLAEGVEHITSGGQQVHGIVLATDAQQYTTLSEQLAPDQLRDLMNQYYETLFTPIRQYHGIISDVVGDAALAIWPSAQADPARREQACLAALEVLRSVDRFNAQQTKTSLPTRLGLHYGDIIMGHVGAVDHYEYRAVGDIVNTATRIEGLNKLLGTRILASGAVLQSLDNFVTRELGTFLLAGKQSPLVIHELIGLVNETTPDDSLFAEGLMHFRAGHWQQALQSFEQCVQQNSADGPSRYYLQLCESFIHQPPQDWDGIIRITHK